MILRIVLGLTITPWPSRSSALTRRHPSVPRASAWMARTRSVSQANRSCRGEGDRRRHLKNPEAATPRMRQHRLAEKPRLASPGDDRVGGFWAHPLLKQRRGLGDQGQFGLQFLDPLSGRSQLPLLAG
jgi:hypothetical protein